MSDMTSSDSLLRSLLAVIFRDGGHRLEEEFSGNLEDAMQAAANIVSDLHRSTGYKTLGRYESQGGVGPIGVHIEVLFPRNLRDYDHSPISRHLEQIHEHLTRVLVQDPEARAANVKELLSCFTGPIFHEEIPNEYSNNAYYVNNPWLIVTTRVGRIKIGHRKRVVQIDWFGSVVTATADELFPDEDVTKDGCMIHAWTADKAREYIARIMACGRPGENQ